MIRKNEYTTICIGFLSFCFLATIERLAAQYNKFESFLYYFKLRNRFQLNTLSFFAQFQIIFILISVKDFEKSQ